MYSSHLVLLRHQFKRKIPKVKNYAEDIVELYTDIDFKNQFRVSRQCYEIILNRMGNNMRQIGSKIGRSSISPDKQLLISLKYLGHMEGMRSLANLFGVSVSSCHKIFKNFIETIVPVFSNELIKWPSLNEFKHIATKFSQNSKFPALIVGAVDSRENPIIMPKDHQESYFNRKGFHSIKIQAICDYKGLFLDVFVGWPGKSHDARTFRNSPIHEKLNESGSIPPDCFLLGDSAYPLKTWLMTPYKGNTTAEKCAYNFEHSKSRQIIECAFGRLVERFRRLKFLQFNNIELCVKICIAACALHNLCLIYSTDNESLNDFDYLNELRLFENDDPANYRRNLLSDFIFDS